MTTAAEPSVTPSVEGIFGRSYRGLTIGVVSLVFLVAFEAMAVATAMPIAVRELDGLAMYAWSFSGLTIASMFATVVAGVWADRTGPFRPLLTGVGLFAVGLALAGFAPTMGVFVAGRMVQGLGAGGIIVAVYVAIGHVYPDRLRPRVFAGLSGAWVLPAIVGPLLAGVVAEQLTWRLVFAGLIPVVAAPALLVFGRVRALPRPESPAVRRNVVRLALAAAAGIGLVQYAGHELRWSGLLRSPPASCCLSSGCPSCCRPEHCEPALVCRASS